MMILGGGGGVFTEGIGFARADFATPGRGYATNIHSKGHCVCIYVTCWIIGYV